MARQLSCYADIQHIADAADPQDFEEVCFPSANIAALLRRWCDRKLPSKNLLLYGPPGTGKTRAAFVLAKERLRRYKAEWDAITYMECESATFDPAFQKLKGDYQILQRLSDPEFESIVILDEIDNFRGDQQKQLKKVVERTDLFFLLLTNNILDLDKGLRDRCLELSWNIPEPSVCMAHLKRLAVRMGYPEIPDSVLQREVYSTAGWRQMRRNMEFLTSKV